MSNLKHEIADKFARQAESNGLDYKLNYQFKLNQLKNKKEVEVNITTKLKYLL